MRHRDWLASLSLVLAASACTNSSAPPAATPTLVNIGGYGKWFKAPATVPDTFGFSTRPAEDVCPDVQNVSPSTCPARYPDTAFIDFSIPTLTSFEVSAGTRVLAEVAQTATMGDYQYRKAALTDGSGATTTWRIAVSVPNAGRTWCPPTRFALDIVDVSGGQPSRSAPLPVSLIVGKCASDTFIPLFSTGTSGTPSSASPPAPVGDCPGGAFAQKFEVCERCGGPGAGGSIPKTFWGCSLSDAQQRMGVPGCSYTLRSGINCP